MIYRKRKFIGWILIGLETVAFFWYQSFQPDQEIGIEHVEQKETSSQTKAAEILIYQLPVSSTTATIEYSPEPKFLSAWGSGQDEIIINGGYFLEDYSPAGFLVAEGKIVSDRMFDEDKSGMIVIKNGNVDIRDLKKFPLNPKEQFDFALQSFPFLIAEANGAVATDSFKKARRTALGIDDKKNIYILVAADREITLYEFMNELLETKIAFTYVLNLDGGPSTGIIGNWGDKSFSIDSMVEISSIVRFWKDT